MYRQIYDLLVVALNSIHNEKDILQKVAQGDQQAFTLLFDLYYQNLGTYIYKVTESRELTEEIVQDVFIKIWEKRQILGDIDNFSAFLFVLSKNKTLDYLRKIAKERTRKLSLLKEMDEESYVIDDLSPIDEYSLIIEQTVAKLPQQQQKVYHLSRHEKLKYEEIAQRMGISKETVKKHMQLALTFLKQHVKARIEDVVLGILLISLFGL